MKPGYRNVGELRTEYKAKRPAIEARLEDFRRAGRLADERLFEELCFCIVAIQSKARASDAAVVALRETELLWSGEAAEIAAFLRHRTRFHNHKAAYIVRARDLAILDRHILRNLIRHGVVRRMPRTLTARRYLDIEARTEQFSNEIGIPMSALDLLFWSRETGEIFK